jgi:hypothetical protein
MSGLKRLGICLRNPCLGMGMRAFSGLFLPVLECGILNFSMAWDIAIKALRSP